MVVNILTLCIQYNAVEWGEFSLPAHSVLRFCLCILTENRGFSEVHQTMDHNNGHSACSLPGRNWGFNTIHVNSVLKHLRGPGSILDLFLWDLFWTEWRWDRVSPLPSAVFPPCQYHSINAPYSPLWEGQAGEAWVSASELVFYRIMESNWQESTFTLYVLRRVSTGNECLEAFCKRQSEPQRCLCVLSKR